MEEPSGIILSSATGDIGIEVDGSYVNVTLTAPGNIAKCTWRYADNRPVVHLSASPGIFTSPYNVVFS